MLIIFILQIQIIKLTLIIIKFKYAQMVVNLNKFNQSILQI